MIGNDHDVICLVLEVLIPVAPMCALARRSRLTAMLDSLTGIRERSRSVDRKPLLQSRVGQLTSRHSGDKLQNR